MRKRHWLACLVGILLAVGMVANQMMSEAAIEAANQQRYARYHGGMAMDHSQHAAGALAVPSTTARHARTDVPYSRLKLALAGILKD